MISRLPPQPWMQTPGCLTLMAALKKAGLDARFVGGCVRDAVLERPVNDVDIAVAAKPEQVLGLLQAARIKAIPTGLKHGTVTAISGGQAYEITSLRKDIETDGRHAKVEFNAGWKEDAARRDFTINAMSMKPDGYLYDYFGGQEDARKGVIRFVGHPATRLQEDYLRLLRFFRFHAFYGTGEMDCAALQACVNSIGQLAKLPGERLRREILLLFAAPDPLTTLQIMMDAGLFNALFTVAPVTPAQSDLDALARLKDLEQRLSIAPDPLGRMAAFLGTKINAESAGKIADRLVFSNREKSAWFCLNFETIDLGHLAESVENFRLIDRLGGKIFTRLLHICAARSGQIPDVAWAILIQRYEKAEFPLSGRDLIPHGLSPGPEMGHLLKRSRDWWLEGGFHATRAECLAWLKQFIQPD